MRQVEQRVAHGWPWGGGDIHGLQAGRIADEEKRQRQAFGLREIDGLFRKVNPNKNGLFGWP